jgi:hypothetical protein
MVGWEEGRIVGEQLGRLDGVFDGDEQRECRLVVL